LTTPRGFADTLAEASPAIERGRIIIRALEQRDRQPILEIVRETEMFTDGEIDIALELVDIVLKQPHQRDYSIFVCENEQGVVGYYCIGPTPATEGTFDLYWIVVAPSVQGRGIGGLLDRHIEKTIRSLGGRLLIAETSSQPGYESTRQFYLRRGYSELSRIKDYYHAGDDLVVFGKYILPSQQEE